MPINGELTFPDVPGKINEHNQSPNAHSVRIDNTVSQSGMAADAKATRDLIENVSGQIEADVDALDDQVTDLKSALLYESLSYYDFPFTIGSYITSGGAVQTSNKLALTDYVPVVSGEVWEFSTPVDDTITNLYVGMYNSSKVFVSPRIDVLGKKFIVPNNISYLRIMFGRDTTASDNLTQSDIINNLHVRRYTDSVRYLNTLKSTESLIAWKDAINGLENITIIPMNAGKYVNLASTTITIDPLSSANTIPQYCAVVSCNPGDEFVINATGKGSAHAMGFVRSNGTKIYSEGIEGTIAGAVIENKHYIAPDNSAYLVINDVAGSVSYKINSVDPFTLPIDLTEYVELQQDLRADKKWYNNSGFSKLIPIDKASRIKIVANNNQNAIVALLTTDAFETSVNGTSAASGSFATGFDGRQTITAGATWLRVLPNDAKYLYVYCHTLSGDNYIPSSVELTVSLSYVNDKCYPERYDVGVCYDNVLKKALQLKNIKWTALSTVPKVSNSSHSAGVIRGIPYSSVKEHDKFVGFNVSLRTFMTAAHNPYSLLYTENVSSDRSTSGYGKTYHGNNCGAYFGAVCNTFTEYAIGMDIPWNTSEFGYLNRLGVLIKKSNQSATDICVGDVLQKQGHCVVITKVTRDSYGSPTMIDFTETKPDLPMTTRYTPAQLDSKIASENYTIYQYSKIADNVRYNPSEFVSVWNEFKPSEYEYNDDVCTFAGDYAAFRIGEDIYINYNLGSKTYTTLNVYNSSGTSVETITLDTTEHKVKLSALSYGEYTVSLTNGTDTSEPTHFEVIETDVSATVDGYNVSVVFTSRNAAPLYAQIVYISGTSVGIRQLSDEEKSYGVFTFDYDKLHQACYPGVTTFLEDVYLKVFFRGKYGVVTNEIIKIHEQN